MEYEYRRLDAWPGKTTEHRGPSPFTAAWSTTLEDLDRELRHLDAHRVLFLVAVGPNDIRRDGLPREKAKFEHPGVVISFESKYGPLKYSCDRFTKLNDNVRAVALGMRALRAVERYGISTRGEQYMGYSALPPGRTTGETLTRAEAWRVLLDLAHIPDAARMQYDRDDDEIVADIYRQAAKRAHPDAGGSDAQFQAASEARRILIGTPEVGA